MPPNDISSSMSVGSGVRKSSSACLSRVDLFYVTMHYYSESLHNSILASINEHVAQTVVQHLASLHPRYGIQLGFQIRFPCLEGLLNWIPKVPTLLSKKPRHPES